MSYYPPLLVDICTQQMFDTSGSASINWNNRTNYDNTSTQSFSWQNRIGYDRIGTESINYGSRTLFDSNQSQSLIWQIRTAYDSSATQSLNWNNRVLSGSWKQQMTGSSPDSIATVGQLTALGLVQWKPITASYTVQPGDNIVVMGTSSVSLSLSSPSGSYNQINIVAISGSNVSLYGNLTANNTEILTNTLTSWIDIGNSVGWLRVL